MPSISTWASMPALVALLLLPTPTPLANMLTHMPLYKEELPEQQYVFSSSYGQIAIFRPICSSLL
jgi:hypothetical protein